MDIRSSQQHGYRQIDKANIKLLHFVSDGAHVRKHKKRKSVVKKGQKHIKLSPGLYIYTTLIRASFSFFMAVPNFTRVTKWPANVAKYAC